MKDNEEQLPSVRMIHPLNQLTTIEVKQRKKIKKLKQNPFQDLKVYDDELDLQKSQKIQNQWIKQKSTPLSISISDHSRINKYYSHKSLQRYLKYLYVKNCPNPLWLSIKRQSQIQHIVFIDIEIENNLFYKYINTKQLQSPKQNNETNSQEFTFKFLTKFYTEDKKAVFKQAPFLKTSQQVWQALLVYDEEVAKQQLEQIGKKQLGQKLTQEILAVYQTYILNDEQRKYNLYPIDQLPAYKEYYHVKQDKNICLKNKILIIDCQMVMSGNTFELARTSIMNFQGQLIYDQFFKPQSTITNYNTKYSGITEQTLKNVSKKIKDLHQDLQKMIDKDTILVGHSLQNDLHAMKFIHNKVIDTSVLFARKNGSKMKLKTLAYNILKRKIQQDSHCSEQDCRATLQIMRQKIQAGVGNNDINNKRFHLLTELQQVNKKVVIIDSDLEFIKHKKEYLGVHFQQCEQELVNKQSYISKFSKYFDKSVKNPDLFLSRIRKPSKLQWEQHYKNVEQIAQSLYEKSPNKTVFLLNFQVNNSIQIFPQSMENILERRRPFCLILVKCT